jgi:hypothetical protein
LELLRKCAEVKGRLTRDLVAEKSGFGSGTSYQRAKKAMEEAIPEIIEKDEFELLGALAEMLVNSGDLDPEVLELWSDTDES